MLFWSTQAKPVEETQKMRDQVLSGFEGGVDYQPQDDGPWLTRVQAELQAGSGTIGVLGALHGSLSSLAADLVDLSDVDLGGAEVNEAYRELATLDTGQQKYLPWMQATYIMAANKKALEFLPEGTDLNTITYDQLIAWSKNLAEKTGSPKFGFPGGPVIERTAKTGDPKAVTFPLAQMSDGAADFSFSRLAARCYGHAHRIADDGRASLVQEVH